MTFLRELRSASLKVAEECREIAKSMSREYVGESEATYLAMLYKELSDRLDIGRVGSSGALSLEFSSKKYLKPRGRIDLVFSQNGAYTTGQLEGAIVEVAPIWGENMTNERREKISGDIEKLEEVRKRLPEIELVLIVPALGHKRPKQKDLAWVNTACKKGKIESMIC